MFKTRPHILVTPRIPTGIDWSSSMSRAKRRLSHPGPLVLSRCHNQINSKIPTRRPIRLLLSIEMSMKVSVPRVASPGFRGRGMVEFLMFRGKCRGSRQSPDSQGRSPKNRGGVRDNRHARCTKTRSERSCVPTESSQTSKRHNPDPS